MIKKVNKKIDKSCESKLQMKKRENKVNKRLEEVNPIVRNSCI
jgi:hypothetical protein